MNVKTHPANIVNCTRNDSAAKRAKAGLLRLTWIILPQERYKTLGETALTDELFGGTTYVESWVGWNGTGRCFHSRPGRRESFHPDRSGFSHQLGGWVLLPHSVSYSISSDNTTYKPFGPFTFAEDRDLQVKFVEGKAELDSPVKARYIKVEVKGIGLCPDWHYGVGYPAWFFVDEVSVY